MVSINSFKFAWRGLKQVLSGERNARIHLAAAALSLLAGIVLRINATQFLVVVLVIIMVFFAEIVNTAIEKILDLTYHENSQLVRFVKDTTAAGVLITAAGAVLVGLIIFVPRVLSLIQP